MNLGSWIDRQTKTPILHTHLFFNHLMSARSRLKSSEETNYLSLIFKNLQAVFNCVLSHDPKMLHSI